MVTQEKERRMNPIVRDRATGWTTEQRDDRDKSRRQRRGAANYFWIYWAYEAEVSFGQPPQKRMQVAGQRHPVRVGEPTEWAVQNTGGGDPPGIKVLSRGAGNNT